VSQELQEGVGPALADARKVRGPVQFPDVLADAMVFPVNATDEADAERRVRESAERYFEETWIHKPLRALGQVPPVDAAGHGVLRKKRGGVVQFLRDCGALSGTPYDFDRLRRKLGLLEGAPAPAGGAARDVSALSAPELAGLPVESLSDEEVERAYQ